jgi:hypothetical protein
METVSFKTANAAFGRDGEPSDTEPDKPGLNDVRSFDFDMEQRLCGTVNGKEV